MEQQELFGEPSIWTVSEVHQRVQKRLDADFQAVTVEGELSNPKNHTSGHWYFTLKDDRAQLRCAMFRMQARTLRFPLKHGLSVRATGRLQIYAPQGSFQLVVSSMLPVGEGALELAFQQLKEKLNLEGLFDDSRKRALPVYPKCVALVTSPTGAAVRDMIAILQQRWPAVRIVVVPTLVQGDAAADDIVRALELVNRQQDIDVAIVGRGGGSLEDLWSFNEERVARAIKASRVPIVSAVGHEIDVTIADYVADCRAATPTAAAAIVTPDRAEVQQRVSAAQQQLSRALSRLCQTQRLRLERLVGSYGLRRPQLLLQEYQQRIDQKLERMRRGLLVLLNAQRSRLESAAGHLGALSPKSILSRGYVFCVDETSEVLVGRAANTHVGQALSLHFHDATVQTKVTGEPEEHVQEQRLQKQSPQEQSLGKEHHE